MSIEESTQSTETTVVDTEQDVIVDNNEQSKVTQEEKPQGEVKENTQEKTGVPEGFSSKTEWAKSLVKEDESGSDREYTDEELDLLEEYWAGNLKDESKPEESEDKKEVEDKSEKESEASENDKKDEEEEDKEDSKTVLSSLDEQIMKEIGAKSKTEILEKIKGLRKAISGKLELAPEFNSLKKDYETLKQRSSNEIALWDDFRAGKQQAIDFVKKNYIPDLSLLDSKKSDTKNENKRPIIDKSKVVDEESADLINEALNTRDTEIDELKSQVKTLLEANKKHSKTLVEREVETNMVDEMVRTAAQLPHLKKIPNIREAIVSWREGKNDDRMDYFNDLFEIANKEGVNLLTALDIDKGRRSDFLIKKGKTDAKKEVYDRKPNRSLSDIQGKTGNFEQYSEDEIVAMERGEKPMPDVWFDDKDNFIKSKVPKELHDRFGL